jgi:glycosyltransferase involved in cell wall biosynthesis
MRPRVVLLRGHHANPWDLRPWERLAEHYQVAVLRTGSNLYDLGGLQLEVLDVRTPRDAFPGGRLAGAAAYALGERYLGLEPLLRGAAIVHSAEIGTWYSAQAARLRRKLGFRFVLTVWETIPWLGTYRWPRERSYRRTVIPNTDLFLPATERARRGLRLEGVSEERTRVCAPGIETAHFAASGRRRATAETRTVLSAGRLVWEKGHQDVLRAVAALRHGELGRRDVRALLVGDGPEQGRLRAYAGELGIEDDVEFRASVPYDEMPQVYAEASCLVLASLPTKGWEEQFGMVLAEAMSAGVPIVASSSGAIPEVLDGQGTLFAPGDWAGLAGALDRGPLQSERREAYPPELIARYSTEKAAERLRAAYEHVMGASVP